jgi:hypothetical protein
MMKDVDQPSVPGDFGVKPTSKGEYPNWWDILTAEQQDDIKAGVADLEADRKKDFKKVLSKFIPSSTSPSD